MFFEDEKHTRQRQVALGGLLPMLGAMWRHDRPAFWRGMLGILAVVISSVAFFIGAWPAKIVAWAALGAWVGILATQYSRKRN